MNRLKSFLISIYVILIILLLLCMKRCNDGTHPNTCQCDTIIIHDTIIVYDSIPSIPPIRETFEADVVMCIDCTNSMNSIINTIKENAKRFYSDVKKYCRNNGKDVRSMRIRVIGFRDYVDDKPFEISDFFNMPEQERDFQKYISQLRTYGGGDAPEIGYDALSNAFNSSWNEYGDVHQVVILWTDAATHPMSGCSDITVSASQLLKLWQHGLTTDGKRLILFAPDDYSWKIVENTFDNVTMHDVTVGGGLSDVDYEMILKTISESI